MALPAGWDAAAVVAACPLIAWSGPAWRIHQQRYAADDPGGSLRVSGRYNRGLDTFAEHETWAALYLALAPEIALGELTRHISNTAALKNRRLSELHVRLSVVLDCRDLSAAGFSTEPLLHDTDYTAPQALAGAALDRGAEAILVPSATRLGDNLIVFPTHLRPASVLAVVASRDPHLHVERGDAP